MYHLKLKKALSYSGIVSATNKKPDVFVEDESVVNQAVASGYFELVQNKPATPAPKKEQESNSEGKMLNEMTVGELLAFASYKGISTKGISKKANIIARLKEKLPEQEINGKIIYGSPTMIELQKNKGGTK